MIVNTTLGPMDEAELEKREGVVEDEDGITNWIEYWLENELVHRSVHITLKQAFGLGRVNGS